MSKYDPMNLVFFSGGSPKENRALLSEIAALRGRKKLRLAFLPAHDDDHEDYLLDIERKLGTKAEVFLLESGQLTAADRRRLFSCDAIYLGGGNTFQFLFNLKKQKLLKSLRKFAQQGGILLGYSAGSILMTPNIKTALVPSQDADENEVEIKDLRALDLVPFEFSPHYEGQKKSDKELERYSKSVPHPIYACKDGAGIWVNQGQIRFLGPVTAFFQGEKFTIN